MLLTFQMIERARYHGKKFLKYRQTTFSGIVNWPTVDLQKHRVFFTYIITFFEDTLPEPHITCFSPFRAHFQKCFCEFVKLMLLNSTALEFLKLVNFADIKITDCSKIALMIIIMLPLTSKCYSQNIPEITSMKKKCYP